MLARTFGDFISLLNYPIIVKVEDVNRVLKYSLEMMNSDIGARDGLLRTWLLMWRISVSLL